jgi:hypothetical protein
MEETFSLFAEFMINKEDHLLCHPNTRQEVRDVAAALRLKEI